LDKKIKKYYYKKYMHKAQLIQLLQHQTLVTLKASPIHGIGVFALVDIPKGTKNIFSDDKSEWIKLTYDEVNKLPPQSIALIENFCLYDEEGYFVPEYGFKMMDLVVYLNHSDTPNIESKMEGAFFETLCDIKAGEELLVDYGEIV
jgi:SET domain-containing protein